MFSFEFVLVHVLVMVDYRHDEMVYNLSICIEIDWGRSVFDQTKDNDYL